MSQNIQIKKTLAFELWLKNLRDIQAQARINTRIRRLSLGNPGDVKAVGHGVSEMRIDYGAGYRVYFISRGRDIILLLCGGDKSSQQDDISTAYILAQEAREPPK